MYETIPLNMSIHRDIVRSNVIRETLAVVPMGDMEIHTTLRPILREQ